MIFGRLSTVVPSAVVVAELFGRDFGRVNVEVGKPNFLCRIMRKKEKIKTKIKSDSVRE